MSNATDRRDEALKNSAMENAAKALIRHLDPDPCRHGLAETPQRVARMLRELLTPPDPKWKDFPLEGQREMVVISQIPFVSMCEHHMLPFMGHAHVGYVPDDRIAGLSKFGRLVDHWSHRLQVQERLCSQVADDLVKRLSPRGVAVVMEATHSCMAIRGVKKPGALTTTAAMRGCFLDEPETRAEFYEHLRRAK